VRIFLLDGSLYKLHYPFREGQWQQHQLRNQRNLRPGQRAYRLHQRLWRKLCRNHQRVQLQQTPSAANYVSQRSQPDCVFDRLRLPRRQRHAGIRRGQRQCIWHHELQRPEPQSDLHLRCTQSADLGAKRGNKLCGHGDRGQERILGQLLRL
jgi:hypothetical protein